MINITLCKHHVVFTFFLITYTLTFQLVEQNWMLVLKKMSNSDLHIINLSINSFKIVTNVRPFVDEVLRLGQPVSQVI